MEPKVAIIETKPSSRNYKRDFGFDFNRYALCSDSSIKTVRKKDVDIEFNPDDYDWVILIGKDALKFYTGKSQVLDYTGKVIDKKFIASINPGMLAFRPEIQSTWDKTKENIIGYVRGEMRVGSLDITRFPGITTEAGALEYIQEAIDHPNKFVAVDSETTGLYPLDGYVLGISISFKKDWGAYIDANCFTEEVTKLFQVLLNKKTVVFHNAKFDIPFIEHHLDVKFKKYEDTMLLHYCLDENPGTHGLKQLALKMTEYGDYESELYNFMADFIKRNRLLKRDFKWEFIPFETMTPYAATDSVVTLIIFSKLAKAVAANPKLNKVYREILLPACTALIEIQQNGVPFDPERLEFGQQVMRLSIQDSINKLSTYSEVKEFEKEKGDDFNANSPKQLRELLFGKLKLNPTGKKTTTKADSTDAEVLKMLSEYHPVPALILNIRKKSKVKNTYLDKIIVNLNRDNRLRTNFNLHGTVAGRLSSSGKLNMQQLPRDASVVKGSLSARKGYKIVSMDLKTAEVYVAAILSGDKDLMQVFIDDADFHSTIAKRVFNLSCDVEEVKSLYPALRQSAKTVTFSILYQAGPYNLYEQVNTYIRDNNLDMSFSMRDAENAIAAYFREFPTLKKWIDYNKSKIASAGYIYSAFGRKRRLPNVNSENQGISSHAIRSGLNFLVQSPASDVNLLATVDMQNWLTNNPGKIDAKIFALVHDSILAEVKIEDVDKYVEKLAGFVQRDRGVSIPNTPIGYEFEVGDDYSFGKFEKEYGELFRLWSDTPVEYREALLESHYGEQR